MQNMARHVERQRPFQSRDAREIALAARLLQSRERLIRASDIGAVMFVVVQLHDLAGDVRLERTVVVRQVGQYVFIHSGSSFSRSILTHAFPFWPQGHACRLRFDVIEAHLGAQSGDPVPRAATRKSGLIPVRRICFGEIRRRLHAPSFGPTADAMARSGFRRSMRSASATSGYSVKSAAPAAPARNSSPAIYRSNVASSPTKSSRLLAMAA